MNKDEIIRMAHEAWPEEYRYDADDQYVTFKFDELERFAVIVAAAEREKCANVCDIHAEGWKENPGRNPAAGFISASNCATAIRARKKP